MKVRGTDTIVPHSLKINFHPQVLRSKSSNVSYIQHTLFPSLESYLLIVMLLEELSFSGSKE